MTKLSVNINKIATLRNSRGGNIPDVINSAIRCQEFGAQGITVHPRPDERHIKRKDVYELRSVVNTEFNIEGYPSREFMDMVTDILPHQVTLVPDATLILNFAHKLLLGAPLKAHGVEFSIDNAFATKLNTLDNLACVNTGRKRFWEK